MLISVDHHKDDCLPTFSGSSRIYVLAF